MEAHNPDLDRRDVQLGRLMAEVDRLSRDGQRVEAQIGSIRGQLTELQKSVSDDLHRLHLDLSRLTAAIEGMQPVGSRPGPLAVLASPLGVAAVLSLIVLAAIVGPAPLLKLML